MKTVFFLLVSLMVVASNTFAAEKECTLLITYAGGKPKTIPIDVENETVDEVLYKKISGSLFIEILVKKDRRGNSATHISVTESQTGIKVATPSDLLLIERDAYRAKILCSDGI